MSPPFETLPFPEVNYFKYREYSLFDEKNKKRERVLSRLLAVPRSIAHQFCSFGCDASLRLVPCAGEINRREIESHRERERERKTLTHT